MTDGVSVVMNTVGYRNRDGYGCLKATVISVHVNDNGNG